MTRTPASARRDPADQQMAFPFIGGRPCLDFVATLGKRHTTPVERLADPGALARWISQAGLPADPDGMRITTEDLADGRALREALYRLLLAAMGGQDPDPADVAHVNEAAARPDLAPQLALVETESDTEAEAGTEAEAESERQPVLHWRAEHPAPAALATVARDAVLLVSGPLLTRVKECANPECALLFLDDSQARRRRWCSMDRCGNLAKVAEYRSRTRNRS
ncbi:CGNR zinc finger domain-containing protein [Streptomyces sp. NPDC002730]|uniref:CGNR zinc finger domain-containing protein n=1 Tax=Streptomyces sp. NPDC002730 TaxID=3364662 RepID=UPI0036BC956D